MIDIPTEVFSHFIPMALLIGIIVGTGISAKRELEDDETKATHPKEKVK
jgi:hypothetical protein